MMGRWIPKTRLAAATDESTADLLSTPTSTRKAFDARIGSVATDIISSDPTVKDAAAAAATTAVTAELDNSVRIPKLAEIPAFVHTLVDRRRRVLLATRTDGKVAAPGGVVTPNAGMPIPDEWPFIAGTYDRARHRFYENVIGRDGRVPAIILEAWGRRFTDTTIASWFTRMGVATGLKKTAPYSLTLPAGAGTGFEDTGTDVHQRHPVLLSASSRRGRVHIRNKNDRTNTVYPGALSVKGIWRGPAARDSTGALNGQWAAAPTQVQGAFTTSADGAEWVSEMLTFDFDAGKDYLIGVGYTCAAQTNHGGLGGSWRSAYSAEVGDLAPAHALTRSQNAALDIWVEFEIDAAVPIIAHLGDSLTIGTNADLPVYESPARKHSIANGVWAAHYAHHGSQMTSWIAGDISRWTKYAGTGAADAVLVSLGSNDIFNGDALATVKANLSTLLGLARSYISPTVYLSTILPRNNGTTANETVRASYNNYLATLPGGAVNVFDYAAAIADPANTSRMDSRYSTADDVHSNTAGYARIARAIVALLALRK
jgi:lysophospholipase L1-like esterase